MQTATARIRVLKLLADERDVHVRQKVAAPFVIERVVAVHEVDGAAGARAPCLRGGLDARRIAEAVVGRESPWAQKRFLGEGARALLGVVLWDASAPALDEVDRHPGIAVVENVAELVEERPDDIAVLLSAARQLDDYGGFARLDSDGRGDDTALAEL